MKLRCRTEVAVPTPALRSKRHLEASAEAETSVKRRRTTEVRKSESEGLVGARKEENAAVDRVLWGNTIKAIQRIGNRISELTTTMEKIGNGLEGVVRVVKASEQTQREMLEEVRQLVWVQDQTRGMVHVVAKRLESLDGVVAVSESELEGSRSVKKKQDKGKGKEIVRKNNEAEELEKSEESEKSGESEVEDVVKGLEISTLDVDESMEVEKKG